MNRIIVFFVGLITVILFLEIGLRVVGFFYSRNPPPPNTSSTSPGQKSFVILCLGNSFTFGIGAPAEQSYPKQLHRLLEKRFGSNIKVINGGRCVENTTELWDSLEARINGAHPDLIVVQTGQANHTNYLKFNEYLKRSAQNKTSSKKRIYYFHEFFSKFRTYRLFSFLYGNIRNRFDFTIHNSHPYRYEEGYLNALKLFRMLEWKLSSSADFKPVDNPQMNEAINEFRRGIKIEPDYPVNYTALGVLNIFKSNYDEALEWFIKAVEINPGFRNNGEINAGYSFIMLMRKLSKGSRNDILNKEIDDFISKFKRTNPEYATNFLFLREEELNAWVEFDIRNIIKIIREKNIGIIIQNYPMDSPDHMNSTLKNISVQMSVPFVDNETVFQGMLTHGAAKEELFAPDGHCNAKGYGVMAENVYNKILESEFLKSFHN